MATPDLIDRLVADLAPVPAGMVSRRILLGLGGGLVVSALAMKFWLGLRPDMAVASTTMPFWIKLAYTMFAAIAASYAVVRIARPGGNPRAAAIAAAALLFVIALLALLQLNLTAVDQRMPLVFGASANVCPWNIVVLAAPVFVGVFWALRGLAPTRLTLAGAAAGLFAGAYGALVYSFHCDESGMPFVALWYTLGIVIPGIAGALLGRLLLRW